MSNSLENLLSQYKLNTVSDYTNALKEIIQQIALLGLWRSKFFEKTAFYGGTALRILYGLDRFSEDLDFSLLKPNLDFKLEPYNEAIEAELQSFGFKTQVETKIKNHISNIESSIIKANTVEQLLTIGTPKDFTDKLHGHQKLKIKMEVDLNPPLNFETETQFLLNPMPFSVNTFQKPDLFATKIHAILCRNWQLRVKGRDWYDFIWYVGQNIPVRLIHLQTRLIKTGHWDPNLPLLESDLKRLMLTQLHQIDIIKAKEDVLPFIDDKTRLNLWSEEFFEALISNNMKVT